MRMWRESRNHEKEFIISSSIDAFWYIELLDTHKICVCVWVYVYHCVLCSTYINEWWNLYHFHFSYNFFLRRLYGFGCRLRLFCETEIMLFVGCKNLPSSFMHTLILRIRECNVQQADIYIARKNRRNVLWL